MPSWNTYGFQNANSAFMEEFIFHYDHLTTLLLFYLSMVICTMVLVIVNKSYDLKLLSHQQYELMWTVLPVYNLILIAGPTLKLLYVMEEFMDFDLTLKVIGHQWYWSYEYSNYLESMGEGGMEFDSYMIPQNSLKSNQFRLLDVDNRVILPFFSHIQVLITSTDVLHAWTIPALGVKMDACPGRLNTISMFSNRPGVFFGQCSEICGANHSFMPIVVEFCKLLEFNLWLLSNWEALESDFI